MTTIAVVGIVGIIALVGLFLFVMKSSPSTGTLAVLDEQGNLLYQISDQNRRVVGQVPFIPAGP